MTNMRILHRYLWLLLLLACFVALPCSVFAMNFNGIEPGVTEKGDVDRILGEGRRGEKSSGYPWYIYQLEPYDSVHIQFDKNVARSVHIRFKELIPLKQVLASLQVTGSPESSETRDDGTIADFYRKLGVIVVYKTAGTYKLACWINMVAPRYVKIENAWMELGKSHPEHFGHGILVHLDFQAVGLMNEAVNIDGIYAFNDELNGNPGVTARSSSYADQNGNAFTRQSFTPRRRVVNYKDYQVFMPYNQLFLSAGQHDLMATLKMSAGSTEMASVIKPFRLTLKDPWNQARILKTEVEHNIEEGGQKGLRVHVHFKIGDCKGKKCVAALFVHAREGLFHIKGYDWVNTYGNLMSRATFTPKHSLTEFKDFQLFLPCGEIRKLGSGECELVGRVVIQNDNDHDLAETRFDFTVH